MSISPPYREKELLCEAAEGNAQSFEELYRLYRNKALSVILTFTKSYAEAEDILQDIFLQFWSGRKNLQNVEAFDAYLFISTRNAIRKTLVKKEKQQQLISQYSSEQPFQSLYPDQQAAKEVALLVNKALEGLPEQQQRIYKMSRHDGLTHEQIGQLLQLSPKTVANTITLVLNHIRIFLGRQGYLLGAIGCFLNLL